MSRNYFSLLTATLELSALNTCTKYFSIFLPNQWWINAWICAFLGMRSETADVQTVTSASDFCPSASSVCFLSISMRTMHSGDWMDILICHHILERTTHAARTKELWYMLMLYASHASRAHSIAHSTPNDPYARMLIKIYIGLSVCSNAQLELELLLWTLQGIYTILCVTVRPFGPFGPFVRKDDCCVWRTRCDALDKRRHEYILQTFTLLIKFQRVCTVCLISDVDGL